MALWIVAAVLTRRSCTLARSTAGSGPTTGSCSLPRGLSRHVVRIVRLRSGSTRSRRPSRTSRSASTGPPWDLEWMGLRRSCRRRGAGARRPTGGAAVAPRPSTPGSLPRTAACPRRPFRRTASRRWSMRCCPAVGLPGRIRPGRCLPLQRPGVPPERDGFVAYLVDVQTGEPLAGPGFDDARLRHPRGPRDVFAVLLDLRWRRLARRAGRCVLEMFVVLISALPGAVGTSRPVRQELPPRDVVDRAAHRAAQRPRLRRRGLQHRHRLRRRPGAHPAAVVSSATMPATSRA